MTARPLRVLMTADPLGGVWTYALELVAALEPRDVRVTLATMGAPLRPDQRARLSGTPVEDVFESSFALEWMPDPWDDVERAGEWLLDLERRVRPDVVHLNGFAHAALPWHAPTVVVAHSDVLSWWEAVKGEPAPPEWNRYRREVSTGVAAAGVVVAPTAAVLRDVARRYGPPSRSLVIPNGRSAGGLEPPASKEHLVVAGGRLWDEAKGLRALERAASRLEWPVSIAGDATPPASASTPPSPAPPNVTLLGELPWPEWAALLRRAAVAVFPARYEPFGLAALEAGLAGCALVVGDIPSLREVWDDDAVFVPPADEDAIADAISGLIHGEVFRVSVAERCRRRALTFTPERMATAYADLYADVASTAAAPVRTGGRP